MKILNVLEYITIKINPQKSLRLSKTNATAAFSPLKCICMDIILTQMLDTEITQQLTTQEHYFRTCCHPLVTLIIMSK